MQPSIFSASSDDRPMQEQLDALKAALNAIVDEYERTGTIAESIPVMYRIAYEALGREPLAF